MLAQVLSVFVTLLKILAAYLFYMKIVKVWYERFSHRGRGITFMSTIPKPIIGDVGEFIKRVMA